MIENKLISIIVPVYNVEKYLKKCIDSILQQTYTNLEVILVDDGSTDNCPKICDEYVMIDDRIKVIHKKNGGLSDARNSGMAIAEGEFIGFVDSDDWIDPDMYETLLNLIEKYNAEISEIGVRYVYSDKTLDTSIERDEVYSMRSAMCGFLDRTIEIQGSVWGKLYKAQIAKGIPFQIGRFHEDAFFTYKAIYECSKFARSYLCKYNYRQQRPGSIMTTTGVVNSKSYHDVIDAFEERNDFFRQKCETIFLEKSQAYYYKTLTCYLRHVLRLTTNEYFELKLFLIGRINLQHKDILKNRCLGFWKIKYMGFRFLNKNLFTN